VPSWEGWAKSVMEGPVKSKEELDSLADRFDQDITYTVSPRKAKQGRYGAESSDKHQTPELRPVTQSFEGIQVQHHACILHEEWPGLKHVANQESIRDATWEIQAEVSSLKRSAGADIDNIEVKTSRTRDVLGERPEDFGTTTVWALVERMESDLSRMQSDVVRKGDQLTEPRTHLTAMVSGVAATAGSAAQKAMKDCLMSGEVHEVIRSSY
jgi:hypothetical protein